MLDGGPPPRPRPGWRRRVQDRVTLPGLIAAGLMVVLIVALIVIGRTAPSVGPGGVTNGGNPSGSATPLFTPPGVSGVATPPGSGAPTSGAATAGPSSATPGPTGSTAQASFVTGPAASPTPSASARSSPSPSPCTTPLVTLPPCPH
ncbi:MAG: hypothetical protein ACYDAC_02680 [Candidatus Dormibacteria bacterium]